jgi:hypothetical protein
MKECGENMENMDPGLKTSSGEESEKLVGGADFQAEEQHGDMAEGASPGLHGKGRAAKLFGQLRKPFAKIGGWFRKYWGRYILSPAFLIMLVLSFGMWYTTKLNKIYYNVNIEVRVDIEGHEVVVPCVAEGKGTDLLMNRSGRKPIQLQWNDLEVTPSPENPEYVAISTESLRHAISIRQSDIKIISVIGSIPEIKL